MEGHRETTSAVNEEPALKLDDVELIVENAEQTAAELSVGDGIPQNLLFEESPGREVLVVESVADRKLQFFETYKLVNRTTSNWVERFFVLAIVGVIVRVFVFHGLTGEILGAINIVVALVAMRYVGVILKSISFSKNRYELSEGSFKAFGRSKENDWAVPLKEVKRAWLEHLGPARKNLILETMQDRFVVSGLSGPDSFWNKLPEKIREDSLSIIEEKLNSSIAACHQKAVEENGRSPSREAATKCLGEVLKEFPETHLLVPDLKKFRDDIFIGLIVTAALSYYALSSAHYALLLLSVILILSGVLAIEKAFSCTLVSTNYGLLEINFKRGTLKRMLARDVKLQADWLDDGCLRLNMPNLVSMPFQADKASLKQLKTCLKEKKLRF